MVTDKPFEFLLVEDDDVDALAFQRYISKSSFPVKVHRAVDGREALAMLRDQQLELGSSIIIVLDLNMPRMNGHEFLSELRQDPALRSRVVFVLTTSDASSDLLASFDKNVAGYILKSNAGQRYEKLIAFFDAYRNATEFPPLRED